MVRYNSAMNKRILMTLALAAVSACTQAPAQPSQLQAYPAELALPFGTASGKVVVSGDYLIFVTDTTVENSFVIPRDNVQDITSNGGVTTVGLKQAMRDQSGERARAIFRFTNAADADAIARWSKMGTADRSSTAPTNDTKGTAAGQTFNYSVKHNHKLGSCKGRLMVNGDRLSFESLTDVNDSRQWSMGDIKELKHNSPYKLEVKPFTGNDYSFDFLGKGMDNSDFTALTKMIAGARAGH
jgi:hypothetical protein